MNITRRALSTTLSHWLLPSLVLVPFAMLGTPLIALGPAAAYAGYAALSARRAPAEQGRSLLIGAGAHALGFVLLGWATLWALDAKPGAGQSFATLGGGAAWFALHTAATVAVLRAVTASWLPGAGAVVASAIGLPIARYTPGGLANAAGVWVGVVGLGLILWAQRAGSASALQGADRPRRCVYCGFDLQGLTTSKCPECGRWPR